MRRVAVAIGGANLTSHFLWWRCSSESRCSASFFTADGICGANDLRTCRGGGSAPQRSGIVRIVVVERKRGGANGQARPAGRTARKSVGSKGRGCEGDAPASLDLPLVRLAP